MTYQILKATIQRIQPELLSEVDHVIVLHLGHSIAAGGAELALFRILMSEPDWDATLIIPQSKERSFGVFEPLTSIPRMKLNHVGASQIFGASKSGSSIMRTADFVNRVLRQSISLRISKEFRRADVIHANTSRAALYGALASLVSRKKLVIHLRDIVHKDSFGKIGFYGFTRIALRRANGVIGNSASTLESAIPFLRQDCKRVVIPSAAGLINRGIQNDHNLKVKTIGMVARLDEWKGHTLLIRAFAHLYADTDVRLVLAGGAPFGNESYAESLRDLVGRLGISSQVSFLGHVTDVAAVIASFDVCVQCSLRPEPLGQNLLQYLAAGRPVIAANAGGPAEWIQHNQNGLLFKMGDELSLVHTLRELDANPDLRAKLASFASKTPGLLSDREVTVLHEEFFVQVLKGTSKSLWTGHQ